MAKAAAKDTPPPVVPKVPKWRVCLRAATPLAHSTLEVEAATAEEAKQKFCEANGISDSTCEWSVDRI